MSGNRWKRYLGLFIWATAFALGVRWFVLEDYRIFSDSMAPELAGGDWVLVSKSRYGLRIPFSNYEVMSFSRPKPGEVVVFALPEKGWATFVKRVVAVEGDEVKIRSGLLYINGKPVSDPPGDKPARSLLEHPPGAKRAYPIRWKAEKIPDYGPVHVPEGHFFVLGDNRVKSVDSRAWGPVPFTCLRGKVSLIWLSVGPRGLRAERIGRWVRS